MSATISINKAKVVLFISLIIICLPTASVLAWNANYLIVDGNGDYAQFLPEGPLDVAYDGSKSFTAEFWVFATQYGAIVSDDAYDIGYNYDNETYFDDVIEFRLYLGGVSLLIKRPARLLNGWHHVVCMFDNLNNRAAIGINGSLTWYSNINDDDGLYNGGYPFIIGSLAQTGGFFTGKIDEVRLSDSVRYPGSAYTVPAAPFTADSNTLGLWHFDDVSGATSFMDGSGNNNHLSARGDAVTLSETTDGHATTYFLRFTHELTEQMGDPATKTIAYVHPDTTTGQEWRAVLGGDISGSFGYHIDLTDTPGPAEVKIKFVVERSGERSTVAAQYLQLDPAVNLTYSGALTGLDLPTQDGDILLFQVIHWSGSNRVGIYHDGQDPDSDSRITVNYLGPQTCFTADPEEGELQTVFEFDAGCTTDDTYSADQLEVRWDWEGDGNWDTGYTTNKTASHQYETSGVKTVKLMVRRPDGMTRATLRSINIPIVILGSFASPAANPAGLAWDGEDLWLSSSYNETIYRMTPDGVVKNSFPSPCNRPFDMVWDGNYLRVICASGDEQEGYKIYKMDTAGTVIGDFMQLEPDYSHGIAWDGYFLWVADATNHRIAQIDPSDGHVIISFRSPGPDPRGLAWDGQYLWNADFATKRIYQLDAMGNIINTWAAPGTSPMGLTWDGAHIWCVNSANHTVYQLTDKIPTTITCELSQTALTLGERIHITGRINPSPGEAGQAVSIELEPPAGDAVYEVAFADINGEFEYPMACDDIYRSGAWNVRTRWSGSGPYEGAVSQIRTLDVSKAATRVTLDVSSRSIKVDEPVSISGKFTPQPDCGGDLENIPLTIAVSGPAGSDIQTVTTNDPWGHFLLSGYTGFNKIGDWSVQVEFSGNNAYLDSRSAVMPIKVVETAGYAIIVQGKISSNEGLASHNKTANFVYQTLLDRGLLEDDIQYFNYDTSQPGVDGVPTKAAIRTAVAQWAVTKMNPKPANLYIVMVDHGLDEFFFIHPDTITSVELGDWIDQLRDGLDDDADDQEIITILGFCRSGSFVDNLSGNYRVVITSADAGESSYKGPLDTDGVREGEYFVSEYFKSVSFGNTVTQSFAEAVLLTETYTSANSGGSANAPYFDNARQHPLLDDNGDGVGTNEITGQSADDGALGDTLVIGVSSVTGNDPGDVHVTAVTEAVFVPAAENTVGLLWAKASDDARLRTIWVEIKPPDFTPGDAGGSEQVAMDLTRVFGSYNDSANRYEWTNLGGFVNPGTYQILYFAKDDITGNISPLQSSTAYKQKAGNSAPNAFELLEPQNDSSQLTELILDWEDASDPNGDALTYTVLLSEGNAAFSQPIKIDGLTYSACLITVEDSLNDLSAYYWKVLAIDEYGAIRESGIRLFNTNNTNPVVGWVHGKVYDYTSSQPIVSAQVTIGTSSFSTDLGGYYLGMLPPGSYPVTAQADGYSVQTGLNIELPEGGLIANDFGLLPAFLLDTDSDGLPDHIETGCTSRLDADSDDDGLADGVEDKNRNGILDPGETDPCEVDSDDDGIQDGTELGITTPVADPDGAGPAVGTHTGVFIPDQDPGTITNPLSEDSDNDGILDGREDRNQNGRVDAGESDPNYFNVPFLPHIPLLLLNY